MPDQLTVGELVRGVLHVGVGLFGALPLVEVYFEGARIGPLLRVDVRLIVD